MPRPGPDLHHFTNWCGKDRGVKNSQALQVSSLVFGGLGKGSNGGNEDELLRLNSSKTGNE